MNTADQREALARSLTNQTPTAEQVERIEAIRTAARDLGAEVLERCPFSRERSLALTHLEETTMWAVKAVVLES